MIDFTRRKTDALVLAGGLNDEAMLRLTGEKARCFIKVGELPLLEIVLKALRGCSAVGRITCVGNAERLEHLRGTLIDDIIPEGESLQENFLNGLKSFENSDYVLVTTADIPLISAEIFDNLFSLFSRDEVDLYYPIIPIDIVEARFPGGKRTVQKLKEGEFTGGNIFLLNPGAVIRNKPKFDRIIECRKNKYEMVKLFGLPFIIKYMTNNLDLASLEKKAFNILGCSVKGVPCPHAEVGFDIDKPEDYKVAVEVIKKRNGGD